mmetsp:Transcript_115152/g.215584  ORF Transcript_115152/g.215584 Transcript_115152/m.215584 type:complete len:196 (-) Transcript_115152:132-719(-)
MQAMETQMVWEPLHRTLSAQSPCLRKQDSRKRRRIEHHIKIEAASITEYSYTPVLAEEVKESLYEPCPEDAIECDICQGRFRRPQGRLCGAPGRPWSVQQNFICRWCFNVLTGPSANTAIQGAVEECLSVLHRSSAEQHSPDSPESPTEQHSPDSPESPEPVELTDENRPPCSWQDCEYQKGELAQYSKIIEDDI